MKTRKRTFIKTVLLSLVRYERWKRNPKNIERIILQEQWKHGLWFTWSIALLFLVSSCAPAKKIEKSSLKVDVKTETQVTKTAEEKTDLTTSVNTEKKADESIKKTVSADENEQTTIHTINYDPKSEVVPGTDRPKVISETIQQTTKGKKAVESTETLYSSNEVTQLFSTYFKTYNSKVDSFAKANTSLKSEISTKTTQASNWWKWFLGGIGIAALLWLIIYFRLWHFLSFTWLIKK